ncbi:MAG: hypothetical protein KGN36_21965 [Acidobacteriota bacterium]|nr:hypothetical protein [Acidobacteriota bacterium]
MLTTIGLPELLVILGIVVTLGVLAVAGFLLVRLASGGSRMKVCPKCSQQIPEFGVYFPLCGERIG